MNITPLSPALGANVDGVDLAAVTDAEFETIYQAWLDHGVLRIRGQSLDDPRNWSGSARASGRSRRSRSSCRKRS